MKRDMGLVRSILLEIEQQEAGYVQYSSDIKKYAKDEINYHIYIMLQAGLLAGNSIESQASFIPRDFAGIHLTWQGHEFLESARDETRWEKAMNMVKSQGGSVTIGVLTQLLSSLMKEALGFH